MQWTVRPYTPADEAEWDRFVMHESGNGTFCRPATFELPPRGPVHGCLAHGL